MANFLEYLWPVLLAIYIISPIDAHPLLWDDLIAAGVLFYLLYKKTRHKKQQQYDNYYSRSQQNGKNKTGESRETFTLNDAYELLGVGPAASWEEITRAYKEKMTKSHPDKVSHLSEELQEKAEEITLRLNEAIAMIKRSKGR